MSLVNHGSQLVASVADDGPGVPKSDCERIFRRFYRVEGSIRTAGTGLGLSLVAAVAELHGVKFCATDNMPGLRMTLTFDCGVLNTRRPRSPGSRAINHDLAHADREIAHRGPERAEEVVLQKLGNALPSDASRVKQHVSDSIKIDNLRVAEPTQTTCWMGASSEPPRPGS